jgi:hypothetical protein
LAFIVCPESRNEIGHGKPSEIILFSRLDAESEPDQMIANRSADFTLTGLE